MLETATNAKIVLKKDFLTTGEQDMDALLEAGVRWVLSHDPSASDSLILVAFACWVDYV